MSPDYEDESPSFRHPLLVKETIVRCDTDIFQPHWRKRSEPSEIILLRIKFQCFIGITVSSLIDRSPEMISSSELVHNLRAKISFLNGRHCTKDQIVLIFSDDGENTPLTARKLGLERANDSNLFTIECLAVSLFVPYKLRILLRNLPLLFLNFHHRLKQSDDEKWNHKIGLANMTSKIWQ